MKKRKKIFSFFRLAHKLSQALDRSVLFRPPFPTPLNPPRNPTRTATMHILAVFDTGEWVRGRNEREEEERERERE